MASSVILHHNYFSSKNTDYGQKMMAPMAVISDEFAGVGLSEDKGDYSILTTDTKYRGVLAAIRGSLFAHEVKDANEKMLYACYYAGMNDPDPTQSRIAMRINNQVNDAIIKEIKSFVPGNLVETLAKLAEADILFDNEEIITEIKRRRINKSKELESILLENKITENMVELEEYGQEIKVDKVREDMDFSVLERATTMPFLEEYFKAYDVKVARAVSYGSSRIKGYYILSKLKSDVNVDFDFKTEFRTEYTGAIDKLQSQLWVAPSIFFRKSSEQIFFKLESKEELDAFYGGQIKLDLKYKLPFLSKQHDAEIYLSNGNVFVNVGIVSLKSIVDPIGERINENRRVIALLGEDIVN